MHLLVVGGAGYIGSVTAAELLAAGHRVTVYDSLITGHGAAVPWRRLGRGDSATRRPWAASFGPSHRCRRLLRRLHRRRRVDGGARPLLRQQHRRHHLPSEHHAGVRRGTLRLQLQRRRLRRAGDGPHTRGRAPQPRQPLRRVQGGGGAAAALVRSQCGLRYISLRYFNAAGATATLGEDHRPETHLIPIVLQVALGRERPSPSTAPTTPPPTAPASATTSTCWTWPAPTSWPWARPPERGERRIQPGQRPGLLQPPGDRGRPQGHRPGHPRARGAAAAGRPPALVASAEKARRELGWRPQFPPSKRSSRAPGAGTGSTPKATPSSRAVPPCHSEFAGGGQRIRFGAPVGGKRETEREKRPDRTTANYEGQA